MENYREIRQIGHGNFGAVFLVEKLDTGEKFVIKKIPIYDMNPEEKDQAKQEVALLSSLNHPCIVRYIDSFLQDGSLHLVQEYCAGGDLSYRIKLARKSRCYFDENQILDWLSELTLAIAYIHKRRILHRDLKSQNIFLTSNNIVRLGDFGIARVLEHTFQCAKTVVGTPFYMSPEVCENKDYNAASDIWALGCVLYELCTLKHAFTSSNLLGLVYKIVQERHPPIPAHYSNELRSLVDRLLSKDPSKRLDAESILQLPFISYRIQKLSLGLSTAGKPHTSSSNGSSGTGESLVPSLVVGKNHISNSLLASPDFSHSSLGNANAGSTFPTIGNASTNVILTSPPLLSPSILSVPLPGSRYATTETTVVDSLALPRSTSSTTGISNDVTVVTPPLVSFPSRRISSNESATLIIPNDDTSMNNNNNGSSNSNSLTPSLSSIPEPPQYTPRPQHQRNITVEIEPFLIGPHGNQRSTSQETMDNASRSTDNTEVPYTTGSTTPALSLPMESNGRKENSFESILVTHETYPSSSSLSSAVPSHPSAANTSTTTNLPPSLNIDTTNISRSRRPSQIQTQLFPSTPQPDGTITATGSGSTPLNPPSSLGIPPLSARSPLPTNNAFLSRSPLGVAGGNVNRRRPSLANAQAIMNAAVNNSTSGSNTPSYMMNDLSMMNTGSSPHRTVSSRSNSIVGGNTLLPMQSPPGFESHASPHGMHHKALPPSGSPPTTSTHPSSTSVPLSLPSRFIPNPESVLLPNVSTDTPDSNSMLSQGSTASVHSTLHTARQEILDHPPSSALPLPLPSSSRRSSLSLLQPLPPSHNNSNNNGSIIDSGRPPSSTPRRNSIRRLEPLVISTQGIFQHTLPFATETGMTHPSTNPVITLPPKSDSTLTTSTTSTNDRTTSTGTLGSMVPLSMHRQTSAENGIGGFTVDASNTNNNGTNTTHVPPIVTTVLTSSTLPSSSSTVPTEVVTPPIVVRRQSTLNRITNESTGITDDTTDTSTIVHDRTQLTDTNVPLSTLTESALTTAPEEAPSSTVSSLILAYPSPESTKPRWVSSVHSNPNHDHNTSDVPVPVSVPSQFFNFDEDDDYDVDDDFQSFHVSSVSTVPRSSRRPSSVISNHRSIPLHPSIATNTNVGNHNRNYNPNNTLGSASVVSSLSNTLSLSQSQYTLLHQPTLPATNTATPTVPTVLPLLNTGTLQTSGDTVRNHNSTVLTERGKEREENDYATLQAIAQVYLVKQQQQQQQQQQFVPSNTNTLHTSDPVVPSSVPSTVTTTTTSETPLSSIVTNGTALPTTPTRIPYPKSQPSHVRPRSSPNDRPQSGNSNITGISTTTNNEMDRAITPENLPPAVLPVTSTTTPPSLSTVPVPRPSSSVYARYDNLPSQQHHHASPSSSSSSSSSSSHPIILPSHNLLSPATLDRVRKLYVDPVTPVAGVSRSNSRVSTPLTSHPALVSSPKGLELSSSVSSMTTSTTPPTGSPVTSRRTLPVTVPHETLSHHPHGTNSRPVSRSAPLNLNPPITVSPSHQRPPSSSIRSLGGTHSTSIRSQPVRSIPIYTPQNIEILRNKCKSFVGDKIYEKLHTLMMERVQNDTNGAKSTNTGTFSDSTNGQGGSNEGNNGSHVSSSSSSSSTSSSTSSLRNRAFTARLLDILNGNRALLPVCAEIEQLIYMEIVVNQNQQKQLLQSGPSTVETTES